RAARNTAARDGRIAVRRAIPMPRVVSAISGGCSRPRRAGRVAVGSKTQDRQIAAGHRAEASEHLLALARAQDAQLLAILRDRAARDVDAVLLEQLDDLLVAVRALRVL